MKRLFLFILFISCTAHSQIIGGRHGRAAGVVDTTFASDVFTEASPPVLLENHVPTLGTAWTKAYGSSVLTISTSGQLAFTTSNGLSQWTVTPTATTANYTVQADFTYTNEYQGMAWICLHVVNDENWVAATYNGGTWSIFERTSGGGVVSLGTYSGDHPSPALTVQLRAYKTTVDGDTVTLKIGSNIRIGPLTTSAVAKGKVGVMVYGGDSGDGYFTNWKAFN
jgi:hypothetical protein